MGSPIVRKMDFKGKEYPILVNLANKLNTEGELHEFHKGWADPKRVNIDPEIFHFVYPHKNDEKYWEQTLIGLYLWEGKKEGEISFITQSKKAFEKSTDAIRKLIEDPSKRTRSGMDVIHLS